MVRSTIRALLLLALVGTAATAFAAQECGFLPTAEIDRAFPEFAPWHTQVGGAVGGCSFLSDERAPPNSVSITQQFKASKADASRVYESMRQGLGENYAATPVSGVGDRALRYSPKDNAPADRRMVLMFAQKDKLIVMITLSLQRAVTDDDIEAVGKLGQMALRGAGDPEMARKASTCPWLDDAGLKKLFGGKPYEVQVHGENSCMAADTQQKPKRVLLVSALAMPEGRSILTQRGSSCQQRELPELGKDAKLSFACKSGSPRAAVAFAANGLEMELTWVTAGTEPSDAEKTILIELAKYARAAVSAHGAK